MKSVTSTSTCTITSAISSTSKMSSLVWLWLMVNITTLPIYVSSLVGSNRREVLQSATEFASGVLISKVNNIGSEVVSDTIPYDVYKVQADASKLMDPSLMEVDSGSFLQNLISNIDGSGGAIWLGEHHNSEVDHIIQTDVIQFVKQNLKPGIPLSIGLEQVQVQYQAVLDKYISGEINETQLLDQVQWEKRWAWPFKVYRPIFSLARKMRIPMIALNVNSEDLAMVEKNGLPGLPNQILSQYIHDRPGFASFASTESFKEYVNYVISPSYELHKQMGLLRSSNSGQQLSEEMSFRNFFSGRMLWDEGMASRAYSWCKTNPGGVMIGLVGADHVKFGKGIPSRFERLAESSKMLSSQIVLNPTPIDSRPPVSMSDMMDANLRSSANLDRLTLQLRYLKEGSEDRLPAQTGGVLPFSEYIIVSSNLS